MRSPEDWEVTILTDQDTITMVVRIEPPFGIRAADAEVGAIKAAEAFGFTGVRALRSRFVREVEMEGARQ